MDYPGEISDILFTQGCNFQCPYCHNPDLISRKPASRRDFLDDNVFKDSILKRENYIDAIVITGGEPLLQKDIISFIEWIKEATNLKVKLDTNGSMPGKLYKLLDMDLIDYVAVDIKLPLDRLDEVKFYENPGYILKTIHHILKKRIDYEFRTTVVPNMHTYTDMKKITKYIDGAKKYVIQNFNNTRCLDKSLEDLKGFTDKELNHFKKIAEKYVDNVEIRN